MSKEKEARIKQQDAARKESGAHANTKKPIEPREDENHHSARKHPSATRLPGSEIWAANCGSPMRSKGNTGPS
jgi:hypothetical protein